MGLVRAPEGAGQKLTETRNYAWRLPQRQPLARGSAEAYYVEVCPCTPQIDVQFACWGGRKKDQMEFQPVNLALEGNLLRIDWSDGKSILYDPIQLRQHCPCAPCHSERAQAAAEGKVPESSGSPVTVTAMDPAGNYAYKITFSDGHSTGLFTLALLRELGGAE